MCDVLKTNFHVVVRKYPVIYDKKGHKDKTMVINAWKNVVRSAISRTLLLHSVYSEILTF